MGLGGRTSTSIPQLAAALQPFPSSLSCSSLGLGIPATASSRLLSTSVAGSSCQEVEESVAELVKESKIAAINELKVAESLSSLTYLSMINLKSILVNHTTINYWFLARSTQ